MRGAGLCIYTAKIQCQLISPGCQGSLNDSLTLQVGTDFSSQSGVVSKLAEDTFCTRC